MAALPPHSPRSKLLGPALVPIERHEGKPSIRLTRPVYIIGARSSARIHLLSSTVSKAHALLVRSNGRTYIRDLASRSHVIINGRQVREADLEDDDIIKIGSFTFKYIAGPGEDVPRPANEPVAAKIDVTGADFPVLLDQRVLLVGRRSLCDINLVEASVSTAHAAIFELDGQRFVRDLGSRTGTFVNGVSTHQHQLTPGDTIHIGETDLRYLPNEVGQATLVDEAAEAIPDLLDLEVDELPAPAARQPAPAPQARRPSSEDLLQVEATDELPVETAPAAKAPHTTSEELEAPIPMEPALEPEPVVEFTPEPQPESAIELEPVEKAEPEAASDLSAAEAHLDIADIASEVPAPPEPEPIELSATDQAQDAEAAAEPTADPALNFPDSLSAPEEPGVDILTVAGGTDEPAGAVLDADALAAGGEVRPEIDLGFEPHLSPQEVREIDLSETDLTDPSIDEDPIDISHIKVIDESLALPETGVSESREVKEAEPILDLVEPIATPQEMTPIDPIAPSELEAVAPLIESSAVAAPPPDEPITFEPAPLETPLSEAPLIPAEPPVTQQAPPIGVPADAVSEDPERVVAVPVKKPRARRPRRQPPAEVIERTEPTTESALQSAADQLALEALAAPDALAAPGTLPSADEMSDTKFGRAVREFVGTEIGEIVEPPAADQTPVAASEPEAIEESIDAIDAPAVIEAADIFGAPAAGPPAAEPPAAPAEAEVELPSLALPEPDRDTLLAIESDFDLAKQRAAEAPEPASLDQPDVEEIAEPVAEISPPERAPAPAPRAVETKAEAPRPPAAPSTTKWGANQDNFLGGVPLNLWGPQPPAPPRPRSPFGGATPPPPFGAPLPRNRGAAAAPEELKSLSGAPPVAPAAPSVTPVGFELKGPQNDDAVKDLIDEIDSVAEAAETAAKTPPRGPAADDDDPPFMGAIPPRPRRSNAMRAPRRRQDESIPANQSQTPTQGTITTGFDGLAMPPVRELDVFSQMNPAPGVPTLGATQGGMSVGAGDLLGAVAPVNFTQPASGADESPGMTRRAREAASRRQTADTSADAAEEDEIFDENGDEADLDDAGASAGGGRPQIAYAAELTESELSAVRRGYVRRVAALILVMLALMGGAAYGIYNYLGVKTTTEGLFRFTNAGKMKQLDRERFERDQIADLQTDLTRRSAVNLLPAVHLPAFLLEPIEYSRAVGNAKFLDAQPDQPDTLSIKFQGTDEQGDRARMLAILGALYNSNQKWIDDARNYRDALADTKKAIEQSQHDLKSIDDEIARLRLLDESRPSREQVDALNAEKTRLENAWNDAVKAVKDAEAEINQLKSQPADSATGDAVAGAEDDKIKSMQTELDRLLARANASRSATSQQAVSARKTLDDALDAFQRQVTEAQTTMNGNPEIAAFIKAAQDLQETTRQLTSELIAKQEQQFGTLMEFKNRLNDKMEQRRAESWQKDKELLDLNERRGIITRQYNAALASGLQKESEDLKVQLDLTNNQIKARQDLLPGDSFYTDAIQQIQQIIDTTRKNIEEDRANAERRLAALQKSFISSQSIQKLPQDQKALAQQLQDQLDRINRARSQYNVAADAGAADADTTLRAEISTLQSAIEARRKQIADENLQNLKNQQQQTRLTAIEARQAELAKLNEAENAARTAYFVKSSEVRDAMTRIDDARKNADTLSALIDQRRDKDALHRDLLQTVTLKQTSADTAVEPIKPSPNDVTVVRGEDRRLLFTLISCGTILVFFFVLILWNVHALSMEAPSMSIRSADLQPMAESPQPVPTGEAASRNGKANGAEDDHEPAVI